MTIGVGGEVGGPVGYDYRGLVVRARREDVLRVAAGAGFSGWVGPQEGDAVVLVPSSSRLLVAAGGRDPEALAEHLSAALPADPAPVLVVEVVRDRLLSLVLVVAGAPSLRYLSDPSVLDPEAFDEPSGAHHAPALARAFGVPGAADALRDVLAEEADPEVHIESERLGHVLRLLGLPAWLVSAWGLPRRVYGAPDPRSLTRLRAGRTGVAAAVVGPAAELARRVRQAVRRLPDGPRPDPEAAGPGEDTGLW